MKAILLLAVMMTLAVSAAEAKIVHDGKGEAPVAASGGVAVSAAHARSSLRCWLQGRRIIDAYDPFLRSFMASGEPGTLVVRYPNGREAVLSSVGVLPSACFMRDRD
ncbi:MAG TPA: hypothetical protein VK558_18910 [Patescibacteria group bacterium]|nr:hypothetical protein [Patescibacteria group bacterium]